ncbi:dimethylarginine dimethylaminohydrolase [soil metagenome]
MSAIFETAAYGGPGWSPRTHSAREEMGTVWGRFGVGTEWSPLRAVLLHRPGAELAGASDANAALMLATPELKVAQEQHDSIAAAYSAAGVEVFYLEPSATPPPNQMFVADLMFMTPDGAIVGRPASTVRAGEERWVARRLADLGVPILRTVGGRGTFEGADAAWIDEKTVLLGRGLRTNAEGAAQVAATLHEIGVKVLQTDLPVGTMHLMGQLRFLDRDLAAVWPRRFAYSAIEALCGHGYTVLLFPDEAEAVRGQANNFVTLGPRRILMAAGNPRTQAFYEEAGVTCTTIVVDELLKAAGGIGCLTGVLERE